MSPPLLQCAQWLSNVILWRFTLSSAEYNEQDALENNTMDTHTKINAKIFRVRPADHLSSSCRSTSEGRGSNPVIHQRLSEHRRTDICGDSGSHPASCAAYLVNCIRARHGSSASALHRPTCTHASTRLRAFGTGARSSLQRC